MKIRFKHQRYQKEAVESVVECFVGQPRVEGIEYRVDPGRKKLSKGQQSFEVEEEIESGFRNHELQISKEKLLSNIQQVQRKQNLPMDSKLVSDSVSEVNLDIEMETGTGKTYVYTKTIFELYKHYGWSKFIIVVPSIAIREGVAQSFSLTKEHFLEDYGMQARYFIYNSKSPQDIKSFSTDGGIQVMIINVQAFNARGKDARRIYEELDEFESRRPIDMIKANRPILILDEPQKMEGKKTIESLKEFDPLMVLRYSATHKRKHNKVYRLDALDAYRQKLVKKIAVKGITVKGLSGTNAYLYLQSIEVAKSKPPIAKIELEIGTKSGIKRDTRKIGKGDNLYELSNELEQYRGYVVSEIDALKSVITFTNGVELSVGEAVGNVDESMLRRIQIREAIKSHLQKEQRLFYKGVKVLTLFFIDEVAKYRIYSDEGQEKGEYAKVFEEEYRAAIKEIGSLLEPEYREYLLNIDVEKTHNGYFSIDKKGRLTNPKVKRRGEGTGESDDVNAYDLILKDKQRLLSFEEPTRFIFSHSALREGWDNPNIFVICTLKHSDNTIARRQEVGRGMRIAVNAKGERMDDPATVHDINVLTVVANESYKDFANGLQKEIAATLSERPKVADANYFKDKIIQAQDGSDIVIDERQAKLIERYLIKNDYVDIDGKITNEYFEAKEQGSLAPLPTDLEPIAVQVFMLIDSLYSDAMLPTLENEYRQKPNPLNDNLKKREFLELWSQINKKAVYSVDFDSNELIDNAANALNSQLRVKALQYHIIEGAMESSVAVDELKRGKAFLVQESDRVEAMHSIHASIKYDLIGQLANRTKLTRRTIGKILQKISEKTLSNYKKNPEEFIRNAAAIINEQKATTIVEHLSYDKIAQQHSLEEIFTLNTKEYDIERLLEVKKHVYDYLVADSKGEREFAKELDLSSKVVVYAKLPRSFFIPTPVGEYNPDWAIAFEEGSVRHIYFVAETKGSLSKMELRKIEEIKIECAKKFFDKVASSEVKYGVIESFDDLMDIVGIRLDK